MDFTKATLDDFDDFKALYLQSFPLSERKPLWMMKKNFKNGKYELYILKDNGVFAGFISSVPVKNTDIVMLDYLAVNTSLRGKGYGKIILDKIVKVYENKKVFLAMEQVDKSAANYPQRLKRQAFYERNGWLDTKIVVDGSSGKMQLLAVNPSLIKPEDYITAQTFAVGKLLVKLGRLRISDYQK